MKSIKRNIASLDIRKGAERCCLTSYKQIGGGISPRSKSRLLNPFTFLLVLALAWAHGAWADTAFTNSADKDNLAGINQNLKVDFGKGLINVYLNGSSTAEETNNYISIISNNSEKIAGTNDSSPYYLKLGGAVEIRFKLTEQAVLNIDYDSSCAPNEERGGAKVYITGEDGANVSYNNRAEITTNVVLEPGTYKISRIAGTTNITSFSLDVKHTTDITKGAVLDHSNAIIYGNYCKFTNGFLDNFANNEYAEFKVSNSKEQYFKFSFKASTNLDGSALEIIYLKSDGTEITRSGEIEVYNNGSWTSFTNEYSHTSDVKIPTDLAKIRLVFYGSGYTVNVRDLTLTPKLDPSPDADAPIRILSVGSNAAPGTFSYNTIGNAIADVNEGERAIIYLGSGTFSNVNIGNRTGTNNKYISIVGEDKATTVFSSDKHRGGDTSDENYVTNTNGGEKAYQKCAALNVYAPRFYGENFTVKNTSGSAGGQAEALNTEGDGFVFNNIQAKGYQDTYLSKSGKRGYFTNSKFVGATDFVWGGGTVWFEESEFNCLNGGAYIFAPEDAKGAEIMRKSDYPLLTSFDPLYTSFFANNCNITAESGVENSSYYLGRAYKGTSGAAVMNSTVDAHIKAQLWSDNGKSDLTYLDYGNTYKNAPNRPSWAKVATDDEATNYLKPSFLFKVMGNDEFDHEAMLRSVEDPHTFKTTFDAYGNATTTWNCSNAGGYILYKDGVFDRVLQTASFTRPASDDSYYAVKAVSKYGVTTQAISFGGGTIFEYWLTATQTTRPECNITTKQNNITLDWGTNTVIDRMVGEENNKTYEGSYMKPGSTAMTLEGNFKAGDVITLSVWNRDNKNSYLGFSILNGSDATVGTLDADQGIPGDDGIGELKYTLSENSTKIKINRLNGDNFLYINHIKISRACALTVSFKNPGISLLDVEMEGAGINLPEVIGTGEDGSTYEGAPTYTIAQVDGQDIAHIYNGKIIGDVVGNTTLRATFDITGTSYTSVDYCEVPLYVSHSYLTKITVYDGNGNLLGDAVDGRYPSRAGEDIYESNTYFVAHGNLETNLFQAPNQLRVELTNPYSDGSKVLYRYHVHSDDRSDMVNYREEEGYVENGTPLVLPDLNGHTIEFFNNSFVIYVEHQDANGNVISTPKTYEFTYIDDKVYFVAQHGLQNIGFDLTITDKNGSFETTNNNITTKDQLSVAGLKMSYGGTVGEHWSYRKLETNEENHHIGSDGVLTFDGWSIASISSDVRNEEMQNYDHRFAMKGIKWNSNVYQNDQGSLGKATNSTGTFSLPVMGGYVKFEPEQNGTIILHILQPGNTYINNYNGTITKGVDYRPFYFLDEAGRSLKLKSYRTTSYIDFDKYNDCVVFKKNNGLTGDNDKDDGFRRMCNAYMLKRGYATFDETNPNKSVKPTFRDEYTYTENGESKTITIYDGQMKPTDMGLVTPQELIVLFSKYKNPSDPHPTIDGSLPEYISNRIGGPYPDDLVHFVSDAAGGSYNHDRMRDGTGYMLITDGFIKYAFDVQAGKTYFPFVYGSRFGMCGYEFIPNQTVGTDTDYSGENIQGDLNSTFYCNSIKATVDGQGFRSITLYDTKDDAENTGKKTNSVILSDAIAAAVEYAETNSQPISYQFDVTVKRNFTKDVWTPIVLPFSVSHTKLEKLFGEGTEVLHFDNIKHEGTTHTLMLRKHYYDMIVAGTPVFIRPKKDISGKTVFNNVTIEVASDSDLDPVENYWGANGKSQMNGSMKSSFDEDEIGYMGLYISGHKFYQNRLPNGKTIHLNALRGWIKTTQEVQSSAKMTNYLDEEFDFGDDTQGIDFIEVDDGQGITTYSNNDIYNIGGQKVGSSFTDMNSLPNGIYVVNGKKYTVNNK